MFCISSELLCIPDQMRPTFDISVQYFGLDWSHIFRVSANLVQLVDSIIQRIRDGSSNNSSSNSSSNSSGEAVDVGLTRSVNVTVKNAAASIVVITMNCLLLLLLFSLLLLQL